jgi:hypothetical protein
LNFRRVICLDLETCLIRPALQAPPVSVCSIFAPDRGAQLFGTWQLEEQVAYWLSQPDVIIIGHNIAYDMCCLFEWYPRLRPLIRKAYEANRILDTGLLWRIIEISKGDMRGGLALDRLCQMVGLEHQSKHSVDEDGDEIRLGFGKHWGTDLSKLTVQEVDYCQDDVVLCWKLFERIWNMGWANVEDLGKLARTDFCLKTISAFGMRCDQSIVQKLERESEEMIAALTAQAVKLGFMRYDKGKPNAIKTTRAYQQGVADAFHIPTRCGEGRNRNKLYPDVDKDRLKVLVALGLVTDTGAVSTGKAVLRASGDQSLIMLADLNEWLAVRNKDLPIFKAGVFHTRFGFANTLRTTSSKPNIQNFRKKAGVRECIAALWGCFVASDYVGLENGTLAQLVLKYTGRRTMAQKISAGHDFHCEVGAHILKISYEEMVQRVNAGDPAAKKARGAAKPANFGLAGNMRNPTTFKLYAEVGYGVKMTLAEAEAVMQLWWDTQHDQMAYLKYVENFKDSDEWGSLYSVPIPGTDIIRRGCTSCAAANTGFQALGMQTAADALWLIVMAQLCGDMPGRACAFVHDEVISDCKPADMNQVKWFQEKFMIEAAEKNLPDVKMGIDTVSMDRWTKDFPKEFAKHNKDGSLNLFKVAA